MAQLGCGFLVAIRSKGQSNGGGGLSPDHKDLGTTRSQDRRDCGPLLWAAGVM